MKKSIKFIVLLFCITIFVSCDKFPPTSYIQLLNNTKKDITIILYKYENTTLLEDTVFIKSNGFYEKSHCRCNLDYIISKYHYIDLYLNNVFFKRYNGYEYWSSEEKSLYNLNYYIETQPNKSKIVYTYTFLPEDFE